MIAELIHLGKLNENSRYADIEVDIVFNIEKKKFSNKKAFIDTGAARTVVNRKLIEQDIVLNSTNYKEKDSHGANGQFKSYIIPSIGIRLNPLFKETLFLPLAAIETIDSDKLPYDVIIGNDVLVMCEFMYNGLSKTYMLKVFTNIPDTSHLT